MWEKSNVQYHLYDNTELVKEVTVSKLANRDVNQLCSYKIRLRKFRI